MLGRHRTDQVRPPLAVDMQRGGAVLLDVREYEEWSAGHAPDAVHVPLARVSEAAQRFAGQQVLTVCRGGNRSAQAATALVGAGIDVRNAAGGMSAWAAAGATPSTA